MEKKDNLVAVLERICEHLKIQVTYLLTKDVVKRICETTGAKVERGLFLIDSELGGRGVDLKLAVNA